MPNMAIYYFVFLLTIYVVVVTIVYPCLFILYTQQREYIDNFALWCSTIASWKNLYLVSIQPSIPSFLLPCASKNCVCVYCKCVRMFECMCVMSCLHEQWQKLLTSLQGGEGQIPCLHWCPRIYHLLWHPVQGVWGGFGCRGQWRGRGQEVEEEVRPQLGYGSTPGLNNGKREQAEIRWQDTAGMKSPLPLSPSLTLPLSVSLSLSDSLFLSLCCTFCFSLLFLY